MSPRKKISESWIVMRGLIFFGGLVMFSCAHGPMVEETSPIEGKLVCLDPGHGGTAEFDSYRMGPTGEREEWIDLRVALILRDLLEKKGAKVLMTRTEDVQVPLQNRALLAVTNKADVFLSLHHNATADPRVNFPIIYYHGNASENRGGAALGRCLARRLNQALFKGKGPVSLVSDFTIFPGDGTGVLRSSYGIPGAIGEASFFSSLAEEERLKDPEYNRLEAEAYLRALEDFFSLPKDRIHEKFSLVSVPQFEVFQEAERMNEIAKRWNRDFTEGQKLFKKGDPESLQKAYDLFTRSARSFPDSPVARQCHQYRSDILAKMGRIREAKQEQKRVEEFYIPLD